MQLPTTSDLRYGYKPSTVNVMLVILAIGFTINVAFIIRALL